VGRAVYEDLLLALRDRPELLHSEDEVTPYFNESGVSLYQGDCRQVLASLPACSVDTVITDPPYGLAFMGKAWDYLVPDAEYWEEVLRVAKPGAMLLAFGGTRTYHRLTCAIEDAGWEIRDCLMWIYGSGFPKSLDISKAIDKAAGAEREVIGFDRARYRKDNDKNNAYAAHCGQTGFLTAPSTSAAKLWHGYGTALKPSYEPIILAMKPLDGTFAENALKHGVAGLHIDGGRIGVDPGGKDDPRLGGRGQWNINRQQSKHTTVSLPPTTMTSSPLGRWPANLLLDEDSAQLLDRQSGESTTNTGMRRNKYQAVNSFGSGIQKNIEVVHSDSGGASRFFYVAKASKSDRGDGNDHPTVKPLDLLKYLCILTATPTGGTVLDPFMGSGTTIAAAKETGRTSIGIEINQAYLDIAITRLAQGVLPLL
jgi:DNA modification methylase